MLTRLPMIILQYIQILNQYVVHLISCFIPNILLGVNCASIKIKISKRINLALSLPSGFLWFGSYVVF